MSDRFTVLLDDENADWLDDEAAERDRSKAWIVNEALRAVRGEVSTYEAGTSGVVNTGEVSTLQKRLDELEARVASLESSPATQEGAHAGERGVVDGGEGDWASRGGGGDSGAERGLRTDTRVRDVLDEMETEWSRQNSSEKVSEMRAACRAVFQRLSEGGEWSPTAIIEQVAPDHPVRGQGHDSGSRSTWWRKTVRPALGRAVDTGLVGQRDGTHEYYWKES